MSLRDLLPAWVDDLEWQILAKAGLILAGLGLFSAVRNDRSGSLPGWVFISGGAILVLGSLVWIVRDRVVE